MSTSPVAPTPAAEIARLVDGMVKAGRKPTEDDVTAIVRELARMFSVKLDEVAVLELVQNDSILAFVYPVKLKKAGSIPMSTTNSLATRTVREKRPEMINNFPAQKHPTVFESISLDAPDNKTPKIDLQPIQKIMSVPLLAENKAVGVIQISRKGKSPTTAGADFTIRDLTTLVTTAGIVAKCLRK
ncbi:MAG: GAF domain-containing protein [Acidobacteria bacterium]|nr:GAF domain-containing protein [Acidobacteriota bacterium]